jgi:hypothetical protein
MPRGKPGAVTSSSQRGNASRGGTRGGGASRAHTRGSVPTRGRPIAARTSPIAAKPINSQRRPPANAVTNSRAGRVASIPSSSDDIDEEDCEEIADEFDYFAEVGSNQPGNRGFSRQFSEEDEVEEEQEIEMFMETSDDPRGSAGIMEFSSNGPVTRRIRRH